MIIPVVMAGGSGSRLWPLSRALHPKQFLALTGEGSLLQETLKRLTGIAQRRAPYILCNEAHRFLVAEQLRQLGVDGAQILLEPEGRNTAPAIALAALQARADGDDPVLLVLAADHTIADVEAFCQSVAQALPVAEQGWLATFGIVPTHAETGYGYIERGEPLNETLFRVARFVEKPDAQQAAGYLDHGGFLWNSGMFLFRASRYLEELERFEPEILAACQAALAGAQHDLDFLRVDREAFSVCPENSIDYAVMEQTERAAVVPLDAGWSDIGSWSTLWEVRTKDADGNVHQGDTLAVDVHDSLLYSEHRLVAALGVQDLVVVETKDAVLVAHKGSVQAVKGVVEALKAQGRSESVSHREVYRPWGVYDSVEQGERFQVKRITVKPGAKLSVQMHHHRAEHWVVVRGTAQVTLADRTFLVTENQSTYIPVGEVHALENPGKIPLELIEVQSGAYLGEDDIVRFEDRYGRQ